ncbi:MAG: T9SS type A sorting domain-containing protein, partial [Paludibacteraceae bacterium]|nr:T9SS type A sorting domain-containing protein [Paludibacteraceae bacterium]
EAEKITVVATSSAIKILGIEGICQTVGAGFKPARGYKAEIINAEGKTVRVSDKTEISTSGIASGVYTIRITTDSNVICKKFTLK